MKKDIFYNTIPTNDLRIRSALKVFLELSHSKDKKVRIIEEFSLNHGSVRIDLAVINGIMHGYEIKSDQDNLKRLPSQMEIYNLVFKKMTLVVGKSHLFEAMKIIPEWWGIIVAKTGKDGSVILSTIREASNNQLKDIISISKLLWKEEAIKILEEANEARGMYSKSRNCIYEKISRVYTYKTIEKKVREIIFFRKDWRLDEPLMLNDDSCKQSTM